MIDLGKIQIEKMDKPVHSRGTFKEHLEILSAVETVLERGQAAFQAKISSRLFIDGGTRDDLSEMVTRCPKPPGVQTYDWLKEVTGSSSFCLALNGINGLSDKIDGFVRHAFNARWIEQIGMPLGGIDTYCFIGKYPITPFGIHTDREHTFLYHLGPGHKNAWLWSPNEFERTQGAVRHQFKFDEVEHLAEKFVLQPGDVLYIPAGHYHVLANPEFSATLGIAPYDRTPRDLILEGLLRCLSEEDVCDGINLDSPLVVRGEESLFLGARHRANTSNDLMDRAIVYVNDEIRRLRSCGGMKFAPLEVAVDIKPDSEIYLGIDDITISHRPATDQIVVYAGGSVFYLPARYLEHFEQLVATLKSNSRLSISEIVTGDDIVDDFRLSTVALLSRHRIFNIHDPAI
jgi:hypothetical protein